MGVDLRVFGGHHAYGCHIMSDHTPRTGWPSAEMTRKLYELGVAHGPEEDVWVVISLSNLLKALHEILEETSEDINGSDKTMVEAIIPCLDPCGVCDYYRLEWG